MSSATSPASEPPEQPSDTSLRLRLDQLLDELARLGAVVDRSHVHYESLAPRTALERERLRALRNP